VLADLDPSSSHHLFELGLLLALLGGAVIGLAGIMSFAGRAGWALASGLVVAGVLFSAGFLVMIVVAHWGTV
jgi:hypothetical protein